MNIGNSIIKGVDRLASTGLTEHLRKLHISDPDKFIVTSALISVVAKDAVGCYYYTTQSLNNKRIPEEKRKFVAALDLVNGGLMILTQLTLGLLVDTKTEDWFNKFIKPHFDNAKTKKGLETLKEGLGKTEGLTDDALKTALKNAEKVSKSGFKLLIPLVASTVVAKRMIVPFIATPLAGKVKEKYMDKKPQNAEAPDTKGIVPVNECMAEPIAPQENTQAQETIDKMLKKDKTEVTD